MNLQNYYLNKPGWLGGAYNLAPLFANRSFRKWAESRHDKPVRFLDVGCGSGSLAKQVTDGLRIYHRANVSELVGTDFIREKRTVFDECIPPLQFVEANLDGAVWPFPNDSFDFILCNH